jgi:peroxiredoxin
VASQPASGNEQGTALRFEDLPGVDGGRHSLARLAGERATVLVFTSGSCPTARSYEDRLIRLAARWHHAGVRLVAINSNNPHLSPADTLDAMTRRSAMRGFNFPYLKDANGAVARSYHVTCTPHAVVLDGSLAIAYTGRIDDSRTGAGVRSRDLEAAVDDIVAGRPVAIRKTEAFGCSIIW